MMRSLTALWLLAALAGCSSRRAAVASHTESTQRREVAALRIDSATLVAVIELDEPRLTIEPDSGCGRRLSARSARVAVVRTSAVVAAVAAADSAAASASQSESLSRTEARLLPRRLLVALGLAALLIAALSWTRIRSRR